MCTLLNVNSVGRLVEIHRSDADASTEFEVLLCRNPSTQKWSQLIRTEFLTILQMRRQHNPSVGMIRVALGSDLTIICQNLFLLRVNTKIVTLFKEKEQMHLAFSRLIVIFCVFQENTYQHWQTKRYTFFFFFTLQVNDFYHLPTV